MRNANANVVTVALGITVIVADHDVSGRPAW
jgi:hypothetical protein